MLASHASASGCSESGAVVAYELNKLTLKLFENVHTYFSTRNIFPNLTVLVWGFTCSALSCADHLVETLQASHSSFERLV